MENEELKETDCSDGSASNDRLYVFAGSFQIAKDFAKDKCVTPNNLHYIDRPEQLRGLSGIKLHVHSTARFRRDFHDIMQMAKSRDVDFVDV